MVEEILEIGEVYGNIDKAMVLQEYNYEVSLLKEYIDIVEDAVSETAVDNTFSYDGICYMFAKAVVDFAKTACDNMLLGHTEVASMAVRALIENNVCLELIYDHEDEELWKYYLIQSLWASATGFGSKEMSSRSKKIFQYACDEYDIDRSFIEKRGNTKAYIEFDYGWTYKINKKFSFRALCDFVPEGFYRYFKAMSVFSHGTSLAVKFDAFFSTYRIVDIISSIYYTLHHMVMFFLQEFVCERYLEIACELEKFFNEFVEELDRATSGNNPPNSTAPSPILQVSAARPENLTPFNQNNPKSDPGRSFFINLF